jgi:hypothetical protein
MSTNKKQFVVRYSTEYFSNSCWGVYPTMEEAAANAMDLKQRFLSVQMHREAKSVHIEG